MDRNICLHGHFYQPPREDPWTESIEVQPSAAPYHDWNERILAECYAPNAAVRTAPDREPVNNYVDLSFNFGPTLLSWLETAAPDTYRAVIDADAVSGKRHAGHGGAVAQAYNHLILPLASPRDKRTQVRGGKREFTRRFGREPEGMWLPETAVDVDTLETLAEAGIAFTILAPRQARRARTAGAPAWMNVGPQGPDPQVPYRVPLPSGRSVVVFFYDGVAARGIAFGELLRDGDGFARFLATRFGRPDGGARLEHAAVDGETYGHHHKFGDMALARVFAAFRDNRRVGLTNYAAFLAENGVHHEAEIVPESSWSCEHGVERWRADCGCRTGGEPGWTQAWRAPLRAALEWLRDAADTAYGTSGAFLDPWTARDDYIDVVLDRSGPAWGAFLAAHGAAGGSRRAALEHLEMQRQTQLMFTSCGWFFNDLAGIETVQILRYAGRALELAARRGHALEDGFLARLEQARSNHKEFGTGRDIFAREVAPRMNRGADPPWWGALAG